MSHVWMFVFCFLFLWTQDSCCLRGWDIILCLSVCLSVYRKKFSYRIGTAWLAVSNGAYLYEKSYLKRHESHSRSSETARFDRNRKKLHSLQAVGCILRPDKASDPNGTSQEIWLSSKNLRGTSTALEAELCSPFLKIRGNLPNLHMYAELCRQICATLRKVWHPTVPENPVSARKVPKWRLFSAVFSKTRSWLAVVCGCDPLIWCSCVSKETKDPL